MKRLGRAAIYLAFALATVLSVFPFYWMMIGTTNSSADIIKGKADFGSQLWPNVTRLFTQVDMPQVFFNSFKIALLGTLATLVVASMAGYGFEIFRSRLRERVFASLLLMLTIPFAAIMVPTFVLTAKLHLINTHAAVILPTIASIFMIFYFRQATKAFPRELRDAARVDGLKEWQIFGFVYVPAMRSTYAAATIIAFMASWNSYLWPLIVLQTNERKTITLVVSSLASAYYPDFGVVMVATVLATLPVLIVFFVLQKRFVQGLVGAVK
jgi:lactose/L-arabinose transport system permease protein